MENFKFRNVVIYLRYIIIRTCLNRNRIISLAITLIFCRSSSKSRLDIKEMSKNVITYIVYIYVH